MFMAPDPGLFRLRVSFRAVLGIGLAVTLCQSAGLSLPASIAGGLAALLAMFTVGDPTVRGQAGTTALLPVAGFPVLAVATSLHGAPMLRDTIWLAVVFAGVYARRFGPRGHALGIFAFMMFFTTQFLHAVPGQLPQLYAAVALSLAASSAVRFGAWCIERRSPCRPRRCRWRGAGWRAPPPVRPSRRPRPAPSRSPRASSSRTTAGTGPSAPRGGSSSTRPRAARRWSAVSGAWSARSSGSGPDSWSPYRCTARPRPPPPSSR